MRVTVSIDENLKNELDVFANLNNKSISSVAADAIRKYIAQEKKTNAREKIKSMIGKVEIKDNALEELRKLRTENDRT